ncbi:uncharacterized protein LOC128912279 [Rissa tridactyla]|uniref:uncharacterized protein LOC128912279 n=1 Tax=Rissa tridactyla TaxID=75485 RepID=UPI0023BA7D94|nr:uncharacterized protein LOC128912279 [Rissa tridactyla]XP_054063770.1 uncharacterized protein LOC128912279 [Rissa tridactyla]
MVSQGQLHLKQNNNVLSHPCFQLCFLRLSGHRVFLSMRSPWEYFCSLTLASGISPGYPSPSCCDSSPPSFPTTAFAFLTPASLPPTCWHFHRCQSSGRIACGIGHGSSSVKERGRCTCPDGCFCVTTPENPPCFCCCRCGCQQNPHQSSGEMPAFPHRRRCPSGAGSVLCHVWVCLATSVLCCHLSVVPGVSVVPGISRVLCGSVPARGSFSQGSYPQAGTCVEDFPSCALAFCPRRGPLGAAGWDGSCPSSQLPWAVTLWTRSCLVWAISPVSAAGLALACCRGQPQSRSRVLSPLSGFFLESFAGQKNASAGSSTGKTLPKAGKGLLCIVPGHLPCFRR